MNRALILNQDDVEVLLKDGYGHFFSNFHQQWVRSLDEEQVDDINSRIIDAVMNIIIEYAAENGVFQTSEEMNEHQ